MSKELQQYIEEAALIGATAVGLYATAFFAFTKAQRDWIDERDGGKCQAPFKHACNGTTPGKRHKHHIIPQRYAERVGIDPDFSENGISICENAHVGNGHETGPVIHPDMQQARQEYRQGNKKAYSEAMEGRDEMLEDGLVYWNDQYDRILHARAVKNTQRFKIPWPKKK